MGAERRRVRVSGVLMGVLGSWVLASAWFFVVSSAGRLGLLVFGTLLLAGAVAKLTRPDFLEVDVAALVYGVWLALAPWAIDFGEGAAVMATSAAGVVAMMLASPGVVARVTRAGTVEPGRGGVEARAETGDVEGEVETQRTA